MSNAPNAALSFEEFAAILAEELVLPQEKLVSEAAFVEDLQVDSLALATMMLRLEELGVSIPFESAWEIRTVGDAYRCYLESASTDATRGRPALTPRQSAP